MIADLQKVAIERTTTAEAGLPQKRYEKRTLPDQRRADTLPYPPPLLSIEIIKNRTRDISDALGSMEGQWMDLGFARVKPDENHYRGEKNQYGQRHGIGRVVAPEGDSYFGNWVRGVLN